MMHKTKIVVAGDGGSIRRGTTLQDIMSQEIGSFIVGTTRKLGLVVF